MDQSIVDDGVTISLGVDADPVSDRNPIGKVMPKRPKVQKRPVASASPTARAVESWENEGGAPSMGDQSHKKGESERSVFGDFLEHPGSVGETHFAHDNTKENARGTSRLANSHRFDWREWFVPPIVVPAIIVGALMARALYLYM